MVHILTLLLIAPVYNSETDATTKPISLDDDPSLFPGHMEPLGARQPKTDIEVLTEYPSPEGEISNIIEYFQFLFVNLKVVHDYCPYYTLCLYPICIG